MVKLIDTEIKDFIIKLMKDEWLIAMGTSDTQWVAGKIFSALEPYIKGDGIREEEEH